MSPFVGWLVFMVLGLVVTVAVIALGIRLGRR